MNPVRVTLVISSMYHGGAERVMSILANGWAIQGHEVTLIRLDQGEYTAYSIHSSVIQITLGLLSQSRTPLQALSNNIRRIITLRSAIRRSEPDIVISFVNHTNILTLFATRFMQAPVVVSERIDPSLDDIRGIWRGLRSLSYPLAAMVVCQTVAALQRFHERIKMKGCVIPNPVVIESCVQEPGLTIKKPNSRVVIAMGRLVHQKGFDILLDAFAQVASAHTDWSLQILGDGPLKGQLQSQAQKLGVAGRVHFTGAVRQPSRLLRIADLFVLSSRFEGFPNALCEAMACGLPVVSFDCPSGPADVIREGVDGMLVPPENTHALALVLDRLMANSEERERLAARAPEVLQRFSVDKVLALWEQLFDALLPERKNAKAAIGEHLLSTKTQDCGDVPLNNER